MSDFLQRQRQGAVSGAAAMALKLSDDTQEQEWGRSVLQRAFGTPLDDGPMMSEVAEVMFHPVVNVAAGLTAAVERRLARESERQAVLRLALHPLLKVKKALYKGLAMCWEREPRLCWQAFALGMRLSVEPRSVLYDEPPTMGLKRSAAQTAWMDRNLEMIEADLRATRESTLPSISPPWIACAEQPRRTFPIPGFTQSDDVLLTHNAAIVLTSQPPSALLGNSERKEAVLSLVSDLLEWTIQDVMPPYKDGSGGGHFEWYHAFLEWCAALGAQLTPSEVENRILAPLASAANDRRDEGDLLEYLMLGLLKRGFSQDRVPEDWALHLWIRCCDLLFDVADQRLRQGGGWMGRGYDTCVGLALFSYGGRPVIEHPWPGLDAVRPLVGKWVERFSVSDEHFSYLTLFLTHAGRPLLLDPGLGWMYQAYRQKADDFEFWQTRSNGTQMASHLAQLLELHRSEVSANRDYVRQLNEIADTLITHGIREAASVQQKLATL